MEQEMLPAQVPESSSLLQDEPESSGPFSGWRGSLHREESGEKKRNGSSCVNDAQETPHSNGSDTGNRWFADLGLLFSASAVSPGLNPSRVLNSEAVEEIAYMAYFDPYWLGEGLLFSFLHLRPAAYLDKLRRLENGAQLREEWYAALADDATMIKGTTKEFEGAGFHEDDDNDDDAVHAGDHDPASKQGEAAEPHRKPLPGPSEFEEVRLQMPPFNVADFRSMYPCKRVRTPREFRPRSKSTGQLSFPSIAEQRQMAAIRKDGADLFDVAVNELWERAYVSSWAARFVTVFPRVRAFTTLGFVLPDSKDSEYVKGLRSELAARRPGWEAFQESLESTCRLWLDVEREPTMWKTLWRMRNAGGGAQEAWGKCMAAIRGEETPAGVATADSVAGDLKIRERMPSSEDIFSVAGLARATETLASKAPPLKTAPIDLVTMDTPEVDLIDLHDLADDLIQF
jgi:hypothetical protein